MRKTEKTPGKPPCTPSTSPWATRQYPCVCTKATFWKARARHSRSGTAFQPAQCRRSWRRRWNRSKTPTPTRSSRPRLTRTDAKPSSPWRFPWTSLPGRANPVKNPVNRPLNSPLNSPPLKPQTPALQKQSKSSFPRFPFSNTKPPKTRRWRTASRTALTQTPSRRAWRTCCDAAPRNARPRLRRRTRRRRRALKLAPRGLLTKPPRRSLTKPPRKSLTKPPRRSLMNPPRKPPPRDALTSTPGLGSTRFFIYF
mmetsp:Transcript_13973/g.46273  ORF Transcript_13973/g.46273 Transcript_13973/m.46273 type:complete len:254 (+) Transcript_13973:793-1554(+)